jgi:hypothetical protein
VGAGVVPTLPASFATERPSRFLRCARESTCKLGPNVAPIVNHPSGISISRFDTESSAITTLVLASVYRHVYTYTLPTKPTKQMYSLRLDSDLADLLKVVKERDGIPESEQIRRALRRWFEQKDVLKLKRKSRTEKE